MDTPGLGVGQGDGWVQEIATARSGQVSARSSEQMGTTFAVRLPHSFLDDERCRLLLDTLASGVFRRELSVLGYLAVREQDR